MTGPKGRLECTYVVNGRSFTYKEERPRGGLLCESEETKAMCNRLGYAESVPEFLTLFADLLENYEGHRIIRPVRYSEATGEPVEWGFVDPESPNTMVALGLGFCQTYGLSPSIKAALINVAGGPPIVFTVNGATYVARGVRSLNGPTAEGGGMAPEGVQISKAAAF